MKGIHLIFTLYSAGRGLLSGGGVQASVLQQAEQPTLSYPGCQGDSGSPLVCEKDGTWYLHRAVSFGKRGCPTIAYTVCARITTYLPWILDKIGVNTNQTFKILEIQETEKEI